MTTYQPLCRPSRSGAGRIVSLSLTSLVSLIMAAGCGSKEQPINAPAVPNRTPGRVVSKPRTQTPVRPRGVAAAPEPVAETPPPAPAPKPAVAASAPVEAVSQSTASLLAAEELFGNGDLDGAEGVLRELLDTSPDEYRVHEVYAELLFVKGATAQDRGDHDGAGKLFARAYVHAARAVELAEDVEPEILAGLHHRAAEFATAANRREQALTHFRAAGRIEPTASRHPLAEAQLLIELNRFEDARAALHRVLEIEPDDAFAYALLAEVNCEISLVTLAGARLADPDQLRLNIQNARTCHSCGRTEEALEALMTLDARSRAEEVATAEIAEVFRMVGEPGKAALIWEVRYMRHPSNWRAAAQAAEAWLKAGAPQAAQWWYGRARDAAPDAPEVRSLTAAFSSATLHDR